MFNIPVLTLKLLVLSWITAKRQLVHNRTASRNTWEQSYDFIIVGAGTGGCTLAYRLTENPNVKVLLLEAGGPQSALYSDMPGLDYNITTRLPEIQYLFYSEPQLHSAKQYPGGRPVEHYGRVIGGSSSHNTMIFNRGNRRNYDEWANKYGAEGWSYSEVLPFFRKYENNTDPEIVALSPGYHGVEGPVQISSPKNPPKALKLLQRAFNELGFEDSDFNGRKGTGTMIMQQFINTNGIRSSAGNAYIDPNSHPNNLHIVTRAQVVKILFDGLTAVGVKFAKNDRPFKVYARKEVILTAGVTNTPKLLMLSGIGINSHLQAFGIPVRLDLPVGNNYMNHPQINIDAIIHNSAYFYLPALLTIRALSELYYQKRGRLSESPYLGLYFNTKSNNQTDWPNGLLYTYVRNNTLAMVFNLARLRSRGTVRLQSSDPHIQPRLDPAFLADPLDFEDTVDAMRFIFFILEKSSIAQYVTPPSFEKIGCPVCPNRPKHECIEGIKCYILYNSQTSYHPCCSCRMGAVDREDVVVDPYLRVKNTKQLRICDSSVFPSVTNANQNAPTHMAAEKCAHIIKKCYDLD